jgi:hypothetical protein
MGMIEDFGKSMHMGERLNLDVQKLRIKDLIMCNLMLKYKGLQFLYLGSL